MPGESVSTGQPAIVNGAMFFGQVRADIMPSFYCLFVHDRKKQLRDYDESRKFAPMLSRSPSSRQGEYAGLELSPSPGRTSAETTGRVGDLRHA